MALAVQFCQKQNAVYTTARAFQMRSNMGPLIENPESASSSLVPCVDRTVQKHISARVA